MLLNRCAPFELGLRLFQAGTYSHGRHPFSLGGMGLHGPSAGPTPALSYPAGPWLRVARAAHLHLGWVWPVVFVVRIYFWPVCGVFCLGQATLLGLR